MNARKSQHPVLRSHFEGLSDLMCSPSATSVCIGTSAGIDPNKRADYRLRCSFESAYHSLKRARCEGTVRS
jgi:hypothetical protein